MNVAVIPARGGSKRIPRKNIKPFYGKPMIAWSIEAAIATGVFDHVIVSTDDKQIASIAKDCGASTPFMRPDELSDDYVGTSAVMAHATNWLVGRYPDIEHICCIYATAPFIQTNDIIDGLTALKARQYAYAFSVTEFAAPIMRSFKLLDNGGVEMFFPEQFSTRSQDLPTAYHDAGQFYWGRVSAWLEEEPIFSKRAKALVVPRWRVQDIDTEDDWQRAQVMAPVILGDCRT